MALMMLFAAISLTAAGYTHLHIPRFVATRAGIVAARGILLAVAVAFGYVTATTYADSALRWLAFAVGFGAVHVPPALILLIKRARGSPKS